ncbi:MAG: hypothetical protein WC601_04560 [Desulfotomaculaceae bacterium]
MVNSSTSQINETIDSLVEKAEQMLQARSWNVEQEEHFEASFKRLNEVLTYLEQQRKIESRMAYKLEKSMARLNKELKKHEQSEENIKGETADNIERLARNIKVIGQVIEIVTESLGVISKRYRDKTETPTPESGEEKSNTVDLSGIMKNLNDIVKSTVETHKSSGEEQAVSADLSYDPEAKPVGDNKGAHMDHE